jgi:4-hydroxy 2-oxovalerate aldolase
MVKILDCTIRDGGYYTNWDFEKSIVDLYIQATNVLPVEYVEVGYRNNPSKEYLGMYGYCPIFEIEDIRNKSSKKLAVMLNEKSVKPTDLDYLLSPIVGMIEMIRIAVDPKNFDKAVILAESIKKRGFEVAFNTMYMSKWKQFGDFLDKLKNINGIVDVFNMVDSYGGIHPSDVIETLALVKEKITCFIGFHGHDNLQMGLVNAITAMDNGVDFVDATILGMGRGAGNLKLELLLTYLNKYNNYDLDFNVLSNIITTFTPLLEKYHWGTNLPYMLSGANSLPQKDVMDWVSNRLYSFNDIVRALGNKKDKKADNDKLPLFKSSQYDKAIIIGGGLSAQIHLVGIRAFINNENSVAIVHATARNAEFYFDLKVPQYFCLTGSESNRLNIALNGKEFKDICILSPYPRTMGTNVPENIHHKTYELNSIDFTKDYPDSCTTIALQTALEIGAKDIMVVGYDGYNGNILSEKENALTNENRTLFSDFNNFTGKKLISLTPTLYKELELISVYQNL